MYFKNLVSSIVNEIEAINIKNKQVFFETNHIKKILNEALQEHKTIKCECFIDENNECDTFSVDYYITCLTSFCELYDVKCYHKIPSKMTEIYYKYGQLINFKRSLIEILNIGINMKILTNLVFNSSIFKTII